MAYKDKEKQRAADRAWWARNSDRENKKRYEKRKENLQWLAEQKKNLSCIRCGENHPACLEFHHTGVKRKEVSLMAARKWSRENILQEIARCIVLCANCHRREHGIQRSIKAKTSSREVVSEA